MKKLLIKGKEFEYKVFSDSDEYNGVYYWTEFYIGTEEETYRKYILFGKKRTVLVPKLMFKVYFNIESPSYTREHVRGQLELQVNLLGRKEEIARGEII